MNAFIQFLKVKSCGGVYALGAPRSMTPVKNVYGRPYGRVLFRPNALEYGMVKAR